MTSFLKSAKHVFDVESDLSYVEIVYDRYKRNKGYSTFTDYINTEPLGDWVSIKSDEKSILYEKFLDTMVKNTHEVQQRMAELSIESFLTYDQDIRKYVRVVHAVKILDPTFQPPRINMESAWQVEFIKKFCKQSVDDAIQECKKKSRLKYFFNVLKLIELEQ
jgi:hypothetical protein|tara:strand:+ start:77 stop:565 length:489 start_codon:yes stop_codon:yes gene_type:complete